MWKIFWLKLWAGHKAFIRGKIIQIASQCKCERKADIEWLEKAYVTLKAQHKRNLSGAQIDKARLELNLALTTKVEKAIRWSGTKFYTQKYRIGPLLATKLSPWVKIHTIPKIRTAGQEPTSNPKILDAFHDYYSKTLQPLQPAKQAIYN